ncbi:MAG: hypothetical protein EGR04_00895 [Blautia sp.]|nr:hypothetical protein [Blautia sp.]
MAHSAIQAGACLKKLFPQSLQKIFFKHAPEHPVKDRKYSPDLKCFNVIVRFSLYKTLSVDSNC